MGYLSVDLILGYLEQPVIAASEGGGPLETTRSTTALRTHVIVVIRSCMVEMKQERLVTAGSVNWRTSC